MAAELHAAIVQGRAQHELAGLHAHEHRNLSVRLGELEPHTAGGHDTLRFLRRWLNHHMPGSDQFAGEHIRAARVRRPTSAILPAAG